MLLRNRVKELEIDLSTAEDRIETLEHDIQESFNDAAKDFAAMFNRLVTAEKELRELVDEIATNGVIRDIRQLQAGSNDMIKRFSNLDDYVGERFAELNRNGVATAINKLNAEVFQDIRESNSRNFLIPTSQEVTLAGKVDALLDKAGIEVGVEQEQEIPAKVVTRKKTKESK